MLVWFKIAMAGGVKEEENACSVPSSPRDTGKDLEGFLGYGTPFSPPIKLTLCSLGSFIKSLIIDLNMSECCK